MRRPRFPAVAALLAAFLLLGPPGGARAQSGGDAAAGSAHLSAGRFAEAAESFRAALARDPGNREARLGLARALSFSGDLAGGEREYRALLAASPADVEARLGLADVLAWQKRHAESEEILGDLARERPEDPEVWTRRGKVALWSGDRKAAGDHFGKALALDLGNEEARRGLRQVESSAAREAEGGFSYLRTRRSGRGRQAWAAVRKLPAAGWTWAGRADGLDRFGEEEFRATAAATRKWSGGESLRLEAALSPGAEVFARVALEAEAARPLLPKLAGYAGAKYVGYATAAVWTAAAALEYYLLPRDALYLRGAFVRTAFDGGGRSRDGAVVVKATHFFTDDTRAWAYYSRGSEGYVAGTIDQIGGIVSDAYGAGGRLFLTPLWALEGNGELQSRDDGERYVTLAAAILRRF